MKDRENRVEVIRLDIPAVANEWRRQRDEMSEAEGREWTNQMFAAYMLDIRQQAIRKNRLDEIVEEAEANHPVDEIAKDEFGLDDTEPRGEVK